MWPGRERRITSPSLLHHPKEQGLAAVDLTGRKGHSSKKKRRSRTLDGREKEKGRRRQGSEGGGDSDLPSPVSDLEEGSPKARDKRRKRGRRKRETQSLPRDALRSNDDSETERGTERGRKREKERRKTRKEKRGAEGGEGEQEVAAVEGKVEERREEVEERDVSEGEESEEDVFLPVPSPDRKLPRPKQNWELEDNWEVAAEYWERRESWEDDSGDNRATEPSEDAQSGRPLPSVDVADPVSQSRPFSFLTSTPSAERLGDDDSESGGSQSDASVTAASVSGLSLAAAEVGGRRAGLLPGPWLTPSQQRVAEVTEGSGVPWEAGRAGRRK